MVVRRAFSASVLICLILTTCSSGSPNATATRSASPSSSPSAALCTARAVPAIQLPCPLSEFGAKDLTAQGATVQAAITTGEASFGPTFIKVPPGAKVTLTITPESPFAHNFIIDGVVQRDLPPNQKQTLSFTLPAQGPVRFYCSIHVAVGMQGAFYFS
ncbi:MAG: cupredoxin domain-containing protein [Actinomycetota bacterium]